VAVSFRKPDPTDLGARPGSNEEQTDKNQTKKRMAT